MANLGIYIQLESPAIRFWSVAGSSSWNFQCRTEFDHCDQCRSLQVSRLPDSSPPAFTTGLRHQTWRSMIRLENFGGRVILDLWGQKILATI